MNLSKDRSFLYAWLGIILSLALLLFNFYNNHKIMTGLDTRGSYKEILQSARQQRDAHETSLAPFGLARRQEDDPYKCSAEKPCYNGACCGEDGWCGYGPTYCGDGCVSNCDATAECGKYAKEAGKKCPLNVCCSEHGFCGFTKDFCTGDCQSNCELDPKPPGGSPKNSALNRVIGYYETWNYRSKCNQKSPNDMPLKELTHLNYAFAFIDPESYELTVMDDQTTEDLWQMTVDTKKYNPKLKVYVAVGGWTFSDNDTVTQPLFGEISSTAANRQKFADGVVRFLNKYGFDGLDVDWEYPGAPDRGGKPEDTDNFTLLMKTLRSTFNGAPRSLGLTFTIPSSFWYLRWFDMPELMKYADWTNLMSYDLHGIWDRNNPIGAIAQAHTNLTEIKQAAQLLWRVGVKPEQVCIGFGFYGRSFELADSKCSKPGCPFSGGARAGPCSKTSGVLMYYEIQAIIDQVKGLKPVHDKEAAVKYIVWDEDQWISYDDGDTFTAKLAWANAIGLGGSLIWAVDVDDDKYSAMSGLMGELVSHVNLDRDSKALLQTSTSVASTLSSESGEKCEVLKDYRCRNNRDLRCEKGFKLIGWDRDGCDDENEGKPICCPQDTAPKTCQWRGTGDDGGVWGDCNGQCHAGEARVATSKWGGGFERESKPYVCARGKKVFCCKAGNFQDTIDDCHWGDCDAGCKGSEKSLTTRQCGTSNDVFDSYGEADYCCPKDSPVYDCEWRGSRPDCVNANCKDDEIVVDRENKGCSWGRKKPLCCKLKKAIIKAPKCDVDSCDVDPYICEGSDGDILKRSEVTLRSAGDVSILEPRGNPRDFPWTTTSGLRMIQRSLAYPGPSRYMSRLRQELRGLARRYWETRSQDCDNPRVSSVELRPNDDDQAPAGMEVEHPLPQVAVSRFASVANYGRRWSSRPLSNTYTVPDGPVTVNRAIRAQFWEEVWNNAQGLPSGLPRVTPTSPELTRPVARLYEAIGTNQNPLPLTLLRRSVNRVKGSIETFNRPMAQTRFETALQAALRYRGDPTEDLERYQTLLAPLRDTIGVFQYLTADDVTTRLDSVAFTIRTELERIEDNTAGAEGLARHWDRFYPQYFGQVSEFARSWVGSRVAEIETAFENSDNPNRQWLLKVLKEIEDQIPDMRYPFEDRKQLPPPS